MIQQAGRYSRHDTPSWQRVPRWHRVITDRNTKQLKENGRHFYAGLSQAGRGFALKSTHKKRSKNAKARASAAK